MQKTLKWFAIVGGMMWTMLCVQNLVRHFVFGWGATPDVIVYGCVPAVGILIEVVIWRLYRARRFAAGIWMAVPTSLLAALYLINAEMPGFN
ncbi:MAG: hypothetical protein WCA81_15255 [Rhizomicrobium sp.]|jgi:hypothetical protein